VIDRYHAWHCAINAHVRDVGFDTARFMYDAKHAAEEVPRLTRLFGIARRGELPKAHVQCNVCASEPQHVHDNHLSCCLGVDCRTCPFLLALDNAENMSDEQKDEAKAWTCVAHVIASGGDPANEGFILTEDDKLFWANVYESMSSEPPESGVVDFGSTPKEE
jgi:hypothetical protein